ncbi:hypothetical protein ACKFKG_27035 [Phormidesmis sp. 146-35]
MLVTVVVINVLLAIGCFYTAWRVWKLRLALSKAADALIAAELSTHKVLSGAPEAILKGQMGSRQLRQSYQQLEPKFQQARQALALLSLGSRVLNRRSLRVTREGSLRVTHQGSRRLPLSRLNKKAANRR